MKSVEHSRAARGLTGILLVAGVGIGMARAAEPAQDERTIAVADGRITLVAPEGWVRKQPATRIVDFEFAAPAAEGDTTGGRLTVMGAGGSVEANIDRWIGQFSQPDGTSTRDRAVIEQLQIAGQKVHRIDISGTYDDRPGPFAPAVQREQYRMLAAIVVTENLGQYFLKFYGPRRTIAAQEDAFQKLLESLTVK